MSRCLDSIAEQSSGEVSVGVVLLFDGVGVGEMATSVEVPDALAARTWVLTANCGSAARSRNAVLEFVDGYLPSCEWVARLDCDDRFATPESLRAAVACGEQAGATAVVGGNRVLGRDGSLLRENHATGALKDAASVLQLLRDMADGRAVNELPSCNLVLRTRSGLRYPDTVSAEDHWLVADLLINRPTEVAILEAPLFADYAVDGPVTVAAKGSAKYQAARHALTEAASEWLRVRSLPGQILGHGQEAIVREHAGRVTKHFYRGILEEPKVAWLGNALRGTPAVPAPEFSFDTASGGWVAGYLYEETAAFTKPDREAVRAFLTECLRQGIVCGNIKRSNFRVRASGELVYVDIGNWIVPMNVSIFRDASARLYAIGVLGYSDEEVLRRPADHARPEIWMRLPGFAEFYKELVAAPIRAAWSQASVPSQPAPLGRNGEVTLLIKACAMDAKYAHQQIVHIVDQLAAPQEFAERVLLIDAYSGPFLRQHDGGDLPGLMATATMLVERGVLDRVIVAPTDEDSVRRANDRWFGVECTQTHSDEGVPVPPQIWAFDQVATRYVLQCDLDVLVGRRRRQHDYLTEMLVACAPHDVVGVAFNIAFAADHGDRPYAAPAGEYKPEVRLGLLDLHRLRALLPLPASTAGGRLTTTWYRALHALQRDRGLRTVRGGHPDTFYVHPPNDRKRDPGTLGRIRDLVAQGQVPAEQFNRWDLEAPDGAWRHRRRAEPVVVVARGRNTPAEKLARFAASLAMQDEQTFGVIVIDDASDDARPSLLLDALGWLGPRLTLVRHAVRLGRMRNNLLAIRILCVEPSTMIVFVDLDDALAEVSALRRVRELAELGHDVILAAPFRPDAPTKVYHPCFDNPRETYGGDVWIHLRAFQKRLHDSISDDQLKLDGAWIDQCEDYATMLPIVEMAARPIYVPIYLYWHERFTALDADGETQRDRTILRILALGQGIEEAQ